MVKIDRIKTGGYKNIQSADLALGNFNVIIGANNSGKSNFIQTIPFLNYVVNGSLDEVEKGFASGFFGTDFKSIVPQIRYGSPISDTPRLGKMDFEIWFSNSETERNFTYMIALEWVSLSPSDGQFRVKSEKLDFKDVRKPGPATNIFSRNDENVKYGSEFSKMDQFEKVPAHFSVLRLFKIMAGITSGYKDALDSLNEILKTPTFYFSHIELQKSENERINSFNGRIVSFELPDEIIKLKENGKWNIFKEALRDILGIENVYVLQLENKLPNEFVMEEQFVEYNSPKKKFIQFNHQHRLKALSQFSDGTILIIALIAKVLSSKNEIIFIEEPENSTHPKALVDLIGFLKSFSENTQFVITSHSIAIINKSRMEEIIASTVNEKGFSEFYNVSSKKDLKNRLKKSTVNFSDELFFNIDDKNEFE